MMRTLTLAIVCSLFAACSWGEGSPSDDGSDPGPDASAPAQAVCGDGTCASSEIGVCSTDCGASTGPKCGNSVCENGEDVNTCAVDCPAVCGDSKCEGPENASTCPGDCGGNTGGMCPADPLECFGCILDPSLCPAGLDPTTCQTCISGGGGGVPGGGACTPDGVCDAAAGEDATTCPFDCM